MSAILENQKVVLGGLANIADEHAKKVLANYNPLLSYGENKTNIKKYNAQQLEACAKLVGLKVRSEDGQEKLYRNKDILADRIILKIESLFEADCSDCRSVYQNTLESTPLFTCRLCLLGSHNCEEVKKKAESMSRTNPTGFVWMCHVCLEKNELEDMLLSSNPPKQGSLKPSLKQTLGASVDKLDTITESEENPDKSDHEIESEEEKTGSSERISPRRGREETRERNPHTSGHKKEQICELFKKRECPHGRSGKVLVDGKTCERSHPKRCYKFCDFGAKHQNGCKKGKKCLYWHPRICKFSMKNIRCEDDQCTFQHLVFTRNGPGHGKEKEKERESYRRVNEARGNTTEPYRRNALPKFSIASSGYTAYPPTINKPRVENQETKTAQDESFLLKLIENMKAGFQEQIDALRNEIIVGRGKEAQRQPIPQQLNPTQGPCHPATRAVPGLHPPIPYPYMMAPQWFNQNFPPLSS